MLTPPNEAHIARAGGRPPIDLDALKAAGLNSRANSERMLKQMRCKGCVQAFFGNACSCTNSKLRHRFDACKQAWLESNPGATPLEARDAVANLRAFAGLEAL